MTYMWRKWFSKIGFFVVELHCIDGKSYVRFAEKSRLNRRQKYAELRLNGNVYTMRLYDDGTAGSNFVVSWKEIK